MKKNNTMTDGNKAKQISTFCYVNLVHKSKEYNYLIKSKF